MFDATLQPVVQRLAARPAAMLAARGIAADAVTLAAFALGVAGAGAVALGWHGPGLVLIAANRVGDGLDGAVARLQGPTDRGAFLDIAADFLIYALVPLGFALSDPAANALPAAVLIAAFVATGSSFLAFAAVAARRGMRAPRFPAKGLYYLGGLTEGAETITLFLVMCLFPQAFPPLAWAFAGLCAITAATRWHRAWTEFGPR
jgi:phosphatidylglycerophosphate synthase